MALWTTVYAGFDADDETANFGTRAFAETNGSIYESFTLAEIQPDREVIDNPNVIATIQHSKVCVALDKSITIFNDESCKVITISSSFDSLITSYTLSKDGYFLFIALASGFLHCLHLPSKGKLVFSKNIFEIQNQENKILKIFTEYKETLDIIVVSENGSIFRISGFRDEIVHKCLIENNEQAVCEAIQSIKCQNVFSGFTKNKVSQVSVDTLNNNDTSVLMVGRKTLMWPSECYSLLEDLPFQYIDAKFLKNQRVLLGLQSDKSLSVVCPWTLLAKKVYDGPVTDFLIQQDHINDHLHLIILREPLNGAETTSLEYVSYPDFQTKFQISVPSSTYLVECNGSLTENIIYMESITNLSKNIKSVRVKALVESMPELRLGRLLKRGKFKEAECFADNYNLNKESIYCAKAAFFVNQSSPWARGNTEQIDLDEFIETLNNISDVKFVSNCCNNVLMSNYSQMKKLLLYARQRILQCIQESSDNKELSNLLSVVSNTLHKLETFEIIRKINENSNESEEEMVNEWLRFSQSDLIKECIRYLAHNNLEAASLIWVQHCLNLVKDLTLKEVSLLLESISEKTPICELWPWLKHFVPSLLSVQPNFLSAIVSWSCRKTNQLEKLHRNLWPQIGLDFVNEFIQVLNIEKTHQCSLLYQQYAEKNSPLQRLITIVQALTDLLQLKENYRIIVPLDTYMDDPTELIHLLLNKVHVEEMHGFIKNFVHQYMLNHRDLKNDHVFSLFIQKTLRNSKDWRFLEEAPWEKRVAIVIKFIHNIQNRLQLVLDVLKAAPVPWSATMDLLAEENCLYDHALVSKIRIEKNSIPVKLILKKYGFEDVTLSNKLINCIIKKADANMIKDILELTKTNHYIRISGLYSAINKCLQNGDVSRAIDIINSLEDDVALQCCKQLINYAMNPLMVVNDSLKYFIEVLNVIESKLKEILKCTKSCSANFDETLLNIQHVKALYNLRKNFNINVSVFQYHKQKEEILGNYIHEETKDINNEDYKNWIPLVCKNARQVANLLNAPTLMVESLLDERMEQMSMLHHKVLLASEEMNKLNDYNTAYVQRICLTSMLSNQSNYEISNRIYDLCVSSINLCHSTELQSNLALYPWITTYMESCCSKMNELDSIYNSRILPQWKLYTIYSDTPVFSKLNVLRLFQNSMKIYFLCRAATGDIICKENFDPSMQESQIDQLLIKWKKDLDTLQMEHLDYSVLKIIKTLLFNCCFAFKEEQNLEVENAMNNYLLSLLQKVISNPSFDLQLGLVCHFMLTENESSQWFSNELKSCNYQTHYNQHRTISHLGWEYCYLLKSDARGQYYKNRILHYWSKKLIPYGISYKEMFNSSIESRRDILKRVMCSKKEFSTELIEEFCQDFDFYLNDCLLLYLKISLKNWSPTINEITGLQIDENEIKKLETKCKNIVSKLEDKSCLMQYISPIESEINCYYYEVFLIIMDLLDNKNTERMNLFYFLQNYTRIGEPTKFEKDHWAQNNPENCNLPLISKWRFPFIPSVDQWQLIKPELNLKTYNKWLEIAPILNLESDLICTLAIRGSVAQIGNSGRSENNSEWSLYPKHSGLLKEMKECINSMKGEKSLEYATAVLYYVANHTPPGADQVAAAQECYRMAKLWQEDCSVPIEDTTTTWNGRDLLVKIKDKYHQFTSKHILYTHGLGQEHYLSLILYPEKLIREIYMNESIPLRYKAATSNRPDINSAADSLGKLFNINMVMLRSDLLLEWLHPNVKDTRMNDSATEIFNAKSISRDAQSISDDNLLRASYILNRDDVMNSAHFLMNISFNENQKNFGPGIRYRALQVLHTIMNTDSLEELTHRDIKSIRKYMMSLYYLNELENVGLRYNISSFENCSKHELVQMLLTAQLHTPLLLSLILHICIDFNIEDYHLWNTTLNQMANLLMVKELETFLPMVATLSHVTNCTGYLSGWQLIISDTFRKIDINPSSKQIEDCTRILRLLHSCPVVNKLKFDDVIQYCFDSKQAQFAVILLPFLNDDQKNNVLKIIKTSFDVEQVISNLQLLSKKGVLAVSYSIHVLREVAKS
ncbi:kinetochore-associated protein 1 isoform X2 [Leptopilina boulardi]|uniref:kinetochore-associated protein 1 isoform X2 n=1 Tax=Leptopilina boulardi TaxID=63433 RepID=UPI0021F65B30|nr:kinetochore-associated protein 1 isoform X2 [Leptopilina boulardi]